MALTFLSVAFGLAGLGTAFGSGYLLMLAIASLFHRRWHGEREPQSSLTVLVPAHNEELLIARCVRALLAQDYPASLFRVLVIADNCADATAGIAAAAGADVWVREAAAARGKGLALRWALDRLLEAEVPPDAVVVVDADSEAHTGLLRGLAMRYEEGADAVQASYRVAAGGGPAGELRAVAIELFNEVRSRGRQALGLPVTLLGNGMLFGRNLLKDHPLGVLSVVEDLEYSVQLRLSGVMVRFNSGALVTGPAPVGGKAGQGQRQRWEGGRLYVLRRYGGRLLSAAVRRRDLSALDAAIDLALPPVGLLAMIEAASLIAASTIWLLGGSAWVAVPWIAAVAGLTLHVLVGLAALRAPAARYRALLVAPAFVAWKLPVYLSLARGFDPNHWVRTARTGAPTQGH